MRIFTRKPRDHVSPATTTTTTTHHEKAPRAVMTMSSKPTFGQWLKATWLDLATMLAMGMIGLGVAPSRSFPIFFQDGEIVYPQFAYPMRNEIVPIWAAALLAALVPIAVFLICQIRIRSFWDVNNATIGLFYSLITAAVFQVFLKWLIGGLRPHFLAVCKPNVPEITAQEMGNGLRQIMYDRTVCTGDESEIDDSLESFPSGHSTAAFAGFVFLFLYLNAKLKVWSNYHPAMWKMVALWAPILGATLIAGALTIDEYHNWYDCLAGAIIGTCMAFSAYRMVYASIWDWRTNHIPLNRGVPFAGRGYELEDATFTRKVGWGIGGGHFGGHHNGGVSGGHHANGMDMHDGSAFGQHAGGSSPLRKPAGGHTRNPSDTIV
ncbi:hypothetical protein HYALB_00009928 [Hymenoscyphus albidus]|uniref:Phosphatidic acid phosphatase type 2/haloperoxidase domain-containing protein n=1 Tax=Hymenoscyphus albidus TaxID=595503 RepID=A0A9N9LP74_9HELO|nr:hypothetical protein HYALB_00009928 [Hymenoscyphus albidus]